MKLGVNVFGSLFVMMTLVGTVAGQLCIKRGMLIVSEEHAGIIVTLFRGLTNIWVILGLLFAVIAAFAWMIALSKMALGYAYPFLSITFPIVVILSSIIFKESISINTYIGLGFIVIGLIIASFGEFS